MNGKFILVGDIGGTTARFALIEVKNNSELGKEIIKKLEKIGII